MFLQQLVHLYEITSSGLVNIAIQDVDDLPLKIEQDKQYWLDVSNHDKSISAAICQYFNIHPNLTEDILNLPNQRPQAETLDNYLYWIVRYSEFYQNKQYHFKKICSILMENIIITFRDPSIHKINDFVKKFNKSISVHHASNADYVALLFLDLTLESIFCDMDKISDKIELLEEMAMKNPKHFNRNEVYLLKRKIIFLKKLINPIIGVTNMLKAVEKQQLHHRAQILLQKLFDLCYRANEGLDLYQQMINNIYDMYLSTTNFYTNRSITILTQFSTVFIPISFIAGVYGMNFKYMPELYEPYAYPIVLGVMAVLGAGIWYYFKKFHQ